jgi:hypothetical protein
MARKIPSKTKKDMPYSDVDKKVIDFFNWNILIFFILQDLFTLGGYIEVFDKCENDSAVLSNLSFLGEDINDDIWKRELKDRGHFERAEPLFQFWDKIYAKLKTMDKNDHVKYIQIFSLLENVFRNVLLRPYIPAYRAINKNCGRYCCFVRKSDERLFKILNFEDNSNNLLIYTETDSLKTIIYAISCNIFWHVLSMKLKEYYPKNT